MRNLLITITALVFVLGCKKEGYEKLSNEVKQKYLFKPGTYWIYRDSITSREDSFYVQSSNVEIIEMPENHQRCEVINVSILQKSLDSSFKYLNNMTIKINKNNLTSYVMMEGDSWSIISLVYNCILPVKESNVFNYGSDKVSFVPSINIGGSIYNQLYAIWHKGNTQYINDSVGFVKMGINDSYNKRNYVTNKDDTIYVHQIWELERCHIVR